MLIVIIVNKVPIFWLQLNNGTFFTNITLQSDFSPVSIGLMCILQGLRHYPTPDKKKNNYFFLFFRLETTSAMEFATLYNLRLIS